MATANISATDALEAARHSGVHIRLDGDDLVLEAPSAPPPAVLDALSRHKVSIIALLAPANNSPTAQDWLDFFDKRAAFFECNVGLSRHLAQVEAFKACVARWLNQNPVTSPAGRCIVCGGSDQPDDAVIPYGTTPPGAAWLHGQCWPLWSRERINQAAAALARFGIKSPTASDHGE
jgi:hypothetical protein